MLRFLTIVLVSVAAFGQSAHAAPPVCNNASEGTIVYNKDHKVLQFCDSADWISMTGSFGQAGPSLPTLNSAQIFVGNASNVATAVTMTGDATLSNAGALTIANNAINSAKIQDGTVSNADLAGSIALSKLSITGTGTAANFLRGDGSWQTVPSGADNLGNHTATQALAMGGFNITGAGTVTATTFSGSGASLTNLPAANLTGTIAAARMPALTGDVTMDAGTTVTDIAANTVGLTELSATGTPSASTYLRGDNTWAAVPAGADNLGDHIATTTLRSDTHNTDDLGTTAIRWKDGWFQGTVTAGTFAGSGASLTALNATNLAAGTVAAARMPALTGDVTMTAGTTVTNIAANTVGLTELSATGTPSASTYLRGDNTWAAVPAGDDLGAGGTTTGTLYSKNASGYGFVGSSAAATGAYMRFDDAPASGGNIYVNILGTWEYRFNSTFFGPYATNLNDLGSSSVRWKDGFFAGNVSAAAYLHTSDERLKKDIVTIDDPMTLINGLRGVHYTWKENDKPAYGFIAQEVEKVAPDAVNTDDQGLKSVEYDQIIAPLVEAVKAQQKQIESLKAEIEALKTKGAE